MKLPVILLSALCGAAIAGGALYWHEHATILTLQGQAEDLHRQLDVLRQQGAMRDRQAKATAATIDELKQQLDRAGAAGRTTDEQRRALEAELARVRRELAATQAEYVSTQAALAKAQATITQLSSPAAKPTPEPIAAKPDVDPLQETTLRSQMARRYAALIQKLGLSPEDADRFLGLMVSRRHAADDVLAAAQAQGGTPAVGDVAGMVGATREGIESDLRALLGDAGYAQFQGFDASSGMSGTVARLQSNLAGTAPLNDSQLTQLQQLLTESGVGHVTPQLIAKAQAQGFLTAEQLQGLQSLYAQQHAAQLQRRTGASPTGTH